MENKVLLSIAIPTYNRAHCLENFLNVVIPHVLKYEKTVQICISNNASTDTTRRIVMYFQERYPDLIVYSENESNLGVAVNLIKVMEMAEGQFVWLLGDDDLIIDDGLEKVVAFIKSHCDGNTGLIALGNKSYFIDKKTGKETVYFHTIEQQKPKVYKIERSEVIGSSFPNSSFLSILIYNNHFLKKIINEEKNLIKKALLSRDYVHNFIYQLMFLKYSTLGAIRYNETIIGEELHYYKFTIEDRFKLHYLAPKQLSNLLLSSKYASNIYRQSVADSRKDLVKNFILDMALMKAFKTFHYDSFFGCITLFFKEAGFFQASVFTVFFVAFFVMPSLVLRILCKTFVRLRYKNWQQAWLGMVVVYSKMSQGTRRQLS